MAFLDHLDELRTRIIRSIAAIAAGMAVSLVFSRQVADYVLATAIAREAPLTVGVPNEGFAFYFDVAFICGVMLAAPFVLYQIWAFVAPGLYAREKRLVLPLVVMSTVGTAAGAVFTHTLLFTSTMGFFANFTGDHIIWQPRVSDTWALYKSMLLGMVIVFQLPTLVFVLARVHLVTAGFLWRNIKYAILIVFVAAAVLTSTPDPSNQVVMAAPMLLMYLVSIGVAWLARPRGRAASEEDQGPRSGDGGSDGGTVGLVVSAAVFDQMRRARQAAKP